MSVETKVESTRKLLSGGVNITADFPSVGEDSIAKLTRYLDRRMARGSCTSIAGGKRWSLDRLSIDLVNEGGTVSVSARENWSPQLRAALLTGLGYGFGLALLFSLLPLSLVVAPVMVSLELTNLVSDVAKVTWAIKLSVGITALVVMAQLQHRAVRDGLAYRRDELDATIAKLPTALE